MDKTYDKISFETSRLVTRSYSTSFSIGVRCLDPSIRDAIYSIYGFVRFADEIVDSFHGFDQQMLLDEFEGDYYKALSAGISLNPILNSFQKIVKIYNIDDHLVQAFLRSMRSDLSKQKFSNNEISEYIYGSAEVVGLMCLKVFVKGDDVLYSELKPYAQRLGAAFQKINFLRDLQHDTEELKRTYFPILKDNPLDEESKKTILQEIDEDYRQALIGIRKLPQESRLGVYTAYLYYRKLTDKIAQTNAEQLMIKRIRVSNSMKIVLFCKAYISSKLQ